jgi:molybdate transport system substrate-binding protein
MKLSWLALLFVAACGKPPNHVSVGAAASLRSAMPELVAAFEKQTGTRVDVRFGPSDALAKQVKDGASIDALVVADETVLDPSLVAVREVIATNPIVLIGPPSTQASFATLTSLPGSAKIAIGDPKAVPIGRYARSYLQQLGSWDALQPRLALGGDAAGVLALAQSGTAQVAIVYRSDASNAAPLVILDAPTDAPVARIGVDVISTAHHRQEAESFARFLMTPAAQAILASHQLAPPPGPVAEKKPTDAMDEKMRHCPLALEGATSELRDIEGGVRFTVHVDAEQLDEVRKRAHHVVEFAAKHTREGHGGFDAQGGGRMKNCPVVTDDVTITARDVDGGAELDVVSASGHTDELRTMTRERVARFPFAGAKITQAP